MNKFWKICVALMALLLLLAACGGEQPAPTEAPPEPTEAPAEPTEAPEADSGDMDEGDDMMDASAVFVSTQFSPVEEQEAFRAILSEGGFDFTVSEDGPMIDQILAGSGSVDVVGTLHGNFPPLARESALTNMADIADDLSGDRDLAQAYIDTGLLGTDDFLHYVPWMQATYIFAANTEALPYLPDGADVDSLTWVQFGEWCQNILAETGEQKCGLPHAGLMHRFLEGIFMAFVYRWYGQQLPLSRSGRDDDLGPRRDVANVKPGINQLRLYAGTAPIG